MRTHNFTGKGNVAICRTQPKTVLADVGQLLTKASYTQTYSGDRETLLALHNASEFWYPGASTTPWQLEGVIRQAQNDELDQLFGVISGGQGIDGLKAADNNKFTYVLNKYAVERYYLDEPHLERSVYEPEEEMLVLHDIFPEGIKLPRLLMGKNLLKLSTIRPGQSAANPGSLYDAIDYLLGPGEPLPSAALAGVYVDLLTLQREIHAGTFILADGTLIVDSNGTLREDNAIFASADQVAIDAISTAMLFGVDPMTVESIQLATEKGLGTGNLADIEISGTDASAKEWIEQQVNGKTLRPSTALALQDWDHPKSSRPVATVLSRGATTMSNLYKASVWEPVIGRSRARHALDTQWGQLFKSYDDGRVALPGVKPSMLASIGAGTAALIAGTLAMRRRRT